MLLKKRLLMCGILFLLLVSIVSAEVCEVDRIKQVLKKILFLYYTEPGSVPLTKDEVKDMLVFYLSINNEDITVDCSALGVRSNKPISDVVNAGDNVADKIPSCADGTKYGECSKSRPAYCYAGAIYSKCDLCGCPTNSVCGKSNKCEPASQNITCFKDIDCGQISFTGSYYCANNYIYKNYVNYTCVNPGTTSSKCIESNGTYVLAYCNPNLNQNCVNGQSTCQTIVSDLPPTVAISVVPTTVAKGQFFNVTVSGTDDVGLAMIWWWAVNTTDAELNKAHLYGCNGARACAYSWLVSTNATGTLTLGANSRDTTYAALLSCTKEDKTQCPGYGEPHQASEGAGIAYATITITTAQTNATKPDLIVTDILFIPSNPTTTDYTKVNITIKNIGTATAWNFSTKVDYVGGQSFLFGTGALPPGATTQPGYLTNYWPAGTNTFTATVDVNNNVAESNENNNVLTKGVIVVATNQTTANQTTLNAPTSVKAGFFDSSKWSKSEQSIDFTYTITANTSAIRLYEKMPGQSVFSVLAEFKNLTNWSPFGCSKYTSAGSWVLVSSCNSPNSWSIWRVSQPGMVQSFDFQPASYYTVGAYEYYITAVDTVGMESSPSNTGKVNFLQPLTILSPNGLSSSTPVFQWTVSSGWPPGIWSGPYFIRIAESNSTGTSIWSADWVSINSSNGYTYTGPALDPTKKYVTHIFGHWEINQQTERFFSLDTNTTTFWV